jgi:hypothetical protein
MTPFSLTRLPHTLLTPLVVRTSLLSFVRKISVAFRFAKETENAAFAERMATMESRSVLTLLLLALLFLTPSAQPTLAAQPSADEQQLQRRFTSDVQPLLQKYCFECHSKELVEAEIDLAAYSSLEDIQRDAKVWVKVRTMLGSRQMPPKDSPFPTDDEHPLLESWVHDLLTHEAKKSAGDPGPVTLRRLSNDEYNYSIRDLTGVPSLTPTREFPIDGAAGEGFTNTGNGQGMSPAMFSKYLDAAKDVADHLVLLPSGTRFSENTSRRDETDLLMTQIKALYHRYGVSAEQGARLPVEKYIEAIIAEQAALRSGDTNVLAVAQRHSISEKYLGLLWELFESSPGDSLLNARLQQLAQSNDPERAKKMAAWIAVWEKQVWKFNVVGHIGRQGSPTTWQEAIAPLAAQEDIRIALPPAAGKEVVVYLSVGDAGDGNADDYAVWKQPRLEAENQPPIFLRDIAGLPLALAEFRQEVLKKTAQYLTAAAEANRETTVKELAAKHTLDPIVLQTWLDYLNIGIAGPAQVQGHYTARSERGGGYDFINGWGTDATPIVSANSSDQEVRVPGIARPHGVIAHPSPTLFTAMGWLSPIDGMVRIESKLSDAHPECGNGVEWFVQHRTGRFSHTLWQGEIPTGGKAEMPAETIRVRQGELVTFILGPRGGNHSCDLTAIDLTITELEGEKRAWDLGQDVSADILAGNPHKDRFGNPGIWHFYKGEMADIDRRAKVVSEIPGGSLLAQWLMETENDKRTLLAKEIQQLVDAHMAAADGSIPDEANRQLVNQLFQLNIPLDHPEVKRRVTKDPRFGRHPDGSLPADSVAPQDLAVKAPASIELRIPAALAAGRTLVSSVTADVRKPEASIQAQVSFGSSAPTELMAGPKILATPGSAAELRIRSGIEEFRKYFPAAVCYDRIVPIDEVVTLTLFFRADAHLQRLCLDDHEKEILERLWAELSFISQEPLQYLIALEQIREFATQDRPDLVPAFKAVVGPANERADLFRQLQLAAESKHLESIVAFAGTAWRRPLSENEGQRIRELYSGLRGTDLSHDAALRLTLARVLTAPQFLYKLEEPASGDSAGPVTSQELATRLSYFLWASAPDPELLSAATRQQLDSAPQLKQQLERMLRDDRSRRLAVQFACQWLHLRNFDQNDDKNEQLYPEFREMRGAMYEETVRFFQEMIRNNGSILDLLAADHTYLNESLASHYGIPDVQGAEWRRVDGVAAQGRGGILGMATVLASQSGASRTSPILRGNWVSETLLGERLPRPPADVPQLPESVPTGLTARELIEQHSSAPACAKCHARIDPYGFALEQFDAIGRKRPQVVDTKTTLFGGQKIEGLAGLKNYLVTTRRDDVVRQFCRKLLGFSLGRELQLSDEPLIAKMQTELAANDYKFWVAIEQIVLSRQFRSIRPSSDGSADSP